MTTIETETEGKSKTIETLTCAAFCQIVEGLVAPPGGGIGYCFIPEIPYGRFVKGRIGDWGGFFTV